MRLTLPLRAVVIGSAMCATSALAAPVDLTTWGLDGPGSWSFDSTNAPNDSATQALNSGPSFLYNNENSQGTSLSGTIEVLGTTDDDFVGFALGYNDGDFDGSSAGITDFILVDWKQNSQLGWDEGMSLSRVTGAIDTGGTNSGSNAWQHEGNVEFIERASTLGDTGWVDMTEYLFDIVFTSTNIQVLVDGIEQFNINGTFSDGSFAFYNFSQPNVRYAGITEDIVIDPGPGPGPVDPPTSVPEPSSLALLGLGLLAFARRRFKRA